MARLPPAKHPDASHPSGRVEPRLKVFQVARLDGNASSLRCHVLNVSLGGALIHCPAGLNGDAQVTVKTLAFERLATVCWRDGPRFGVRFSPSLNDQELVLFLE